MSDLHVLAVDGSPSGGGRTRTVLDALLAGAAAAKAQTSVLTLADSSEADAIAAITAADAFVFSSPVYRASFATPLKSLLDRLPRGMWGETEAPITGRAMAIVMTGATWHHYLALDGLRSVLAGFFAAHVLTPGLYVPGEGFDEPRQLTEPVAAAARAHGDALVALARAVAASPSLREVRPQA
jgi:FMN reductase